MSEYKGIFVAFACLALSQHVGADTTELNWTGCDISRSAYVADLADAYSRNTGIKINLHTGDSSSGIRQVQDGTVDIGGTSRYRIADDPRENEVDLVPVAWDALAIIVHKDNPLTDIRLDQLKAVYAGKLGNWSMLGGANRKIQVFALKSTHSGTGRTLRELLFANPKKYIPASRTFATVAELEQALARNPDAIAMTGVSSARLGEFKTVNLDGVAPSVDNIKTGSYGLYRPLYLAYNPANPDAESVKDFISYINSKAGREVMHNNGVVPYREAMALVMKKVRANEASYQQLVDNN